MVSPNATDPRPAARFSLVDHDGTPVTDANFAGRHKLVYFGFTHCKVVCPRTLAKLSRVLDRLGADASALTPLYVTVDPDRDTPAVMRAYVHANCPRFTGLTGTAAQIDVAKKSFRVFAQRRADPEDPAGYDVPHSAICYLMAPDGAYLDHFTDIAEEDDIVRRIAHALGRPQNAAA